MKIHRLTNNKRVQNLVKKETQALRFKDFVLSVKCATDFPHRIAELDNLMRVLLNKNLYGVMKPKDVYSGAFEVLEGFEDVFKSIAADHGFGACERIVG